MALSNYPDGFLGFQARAETIHEALGSHISIRAVINDCFGKTLKETIQHRLYPPEKPGGYTYTPYELIHSIWMHATDEDFRVAAERAEKSFIVDFHKPTYEKKSERFGLLLTIRNMWVSIEGGEHAVRLAHAYADSHAKSRTIANNAGFTTPPRGNLDPWHVFLTDDGESILKTIGNRPSKAATTAKGEDGATKSLIRLLDLFV